MGDVLGRCVRRGIGGVESDRDDGWIFWEENEDEKEDER